MAVIIKACKIIDEVVALLKYRKEKPDYVCVSSGSGSLTCVVVYASPLRYLVTCLVLLT